MIRLLVRSFIVVGGGADEAKIHEKFNTTECNAFGGSLSSLFAHISLLFEVNIAKWVVLEEGRGAGDVLWDHVELVLARGPKA